jgi:hypothetical protein
MNVSLPRSPRRFLWLAFALLAIPCSLIGQGITSSGIDGYVVDRETKRPVDGATIVATHEPTGTRVETVTGAKGYYSLAGLPPGGPYTVVASGDSFRSETRSDILLDLGRSTTVGFEVSQEVVELAEFSVVGQRDATFGTGKLGTGTDFSDDDVATIATVRRNVQDIARLDPRMVLMSLDQGGQLSAQGQNFRYNSLLVDGVQTNDSFGLNSNGFSSLRSPIPLEAIQGMSGELTPVDVRRSGFSGAQINIVTKSGTNALAGMVHYAFTNETMRADNPVTGVTDLFDEKTWGAVVGGPILKDRLFFFLAYDAFSRLTAPPNQNFVPADADIARIAARAGTFGYEIGAFGAANESTQDTIIAKIDWNIADNHRLAVTWRNNEGVEPVFPSFGNTTQTSFGSYWYDQPRDTASFTARLFNQWTSRFRTEFSWSTSEYDGSPKNRGMPFPEVTVNGVAGTRRDTGAAITTGSARFGTEFSRQLNEITTTTDTLAGSAELTVGDHTLLAGFDWDNRDVTNKFVQAFLGSYSFTSLANWESGTASSLQRAQLAPGMTIDDAIARFDLGMLGLFVQDTWRPGSRFSLTAGLRFDRMSLPDRPRAIPDAGTYSETLFRQHFGLPSTTSPDGNASISPRLGFTWQLDSEKRTQVRGSLGMYQGRNPLVWLSNAYSNRGVVSRVSQSNVAFNPDVTPAAGVGGAPVINFTASDFKQPLTWKGNLALDQELPWGGLVFTVEVGGVDAVRMPCVTNLNLRPVGTMPDGRVRYAGNIAAATSGTGGPSRSGASSTYSSPALYLHPEFADVYYFSNTEKGGGWDFTLQLTKPWKDGWFARLAYTKSRYTEVSPMTSSVAQSNFNGRAAFDANEDAASVSNTNIDDRFVIEAKKRFAFFPKAPTTVSLIYEGRTGRPYSWVFYGDANGDGFTSNDLFYMPSGPSDPRVSWANPAERDAFFAFARSAGLDEYAGRVVPRNSQRSPWINQFDVRITQKLPLWNRFASELFVDFVNCANLLDDDWGILREVPFAYRRTVAGTTYNSATGQYAYRFTGSTLDGVPVVATDTPASRWQIQAGIRLAF